MAAFSSFWDFWSSFPFFTSFLTFLFNESYSSRSLIYVPWFHLGAVATFWLMSLVGIYPGWASIKLLNSTYWMSHLSRDNRAQNRGEKYFRRQLNSLLATRKWPHHQRKVFKTMEQNIFYMARVWKKKLWIRYHMLIQLTMFFQRDEKKERSLALGSVFLTIV